MNPKPSRALSTLAVHVVLILSACAGAMDATPDSGAGDADIDAAYGGGGTVIPTFNADGGAGSGSYTYGSDSSVSPCPRDASTDASVDAPSTAEAGSPDATRVATCSAPLSAGDLIIDELMIASESGAGDHGEWLEVMSTLDCAMDLKGLYAEVPHGKSTLLASIATDLVLPPHGFLVIADSSDPTTNHDLPGTVVTWGTGTSSDVLLNSGDTITLYTSEVTVDTLTYPDPAKLVDGASMAFPSDCDPSLRTAFGNWQPSNASWTPGYFGTPSGPNTDVSCPVAPPPPPSMSPCGD
jgi:hypothetical protein